jgi:hypothetical protein
VDAGARLAEANLAPLVEGREELGEGDAEGAGEAVDEIELESD